MQMQSEQIDALAEALSKAQGLIEGTIKDSKNPFFKSSYADLHSVKECCREPLANNGLSVVQPTQMVEGQLCLVTMLMHKSGQWIKGMIPIVTQKSDPQSLGSAITYFRRYSYCAMIGVSQFDDDAESAMDRKKAAPKLMERAPEKVATKKDLIEALKAVNIVLDPEDMDKGLNRLSEGSPERLAQIIRKAIESEEMLRRFGASLLKALSPKDISEFSLE